MRQMDYYLLICCCLYQEIIKRHSITTRKKHSKYRTPRYTVNSHNKGCTVVHLATSY